MLSLKPNAMKKFYIEQTNKIIHKSMSEHLTSSSNNKHHAQALAKYYFKNFS